MVCQPAESAEFADAGSLALYGSKTTVKLTAGMLVAVLLLIMT